MLQLVSCKRFMSKRYLQQRASTVFVGALFQFKRDFLFRLPLQSDRPSAKQGYKEESDDEEIIYE